MANDGAEIQAQADEFRQAFKNIKDEVHKVVVGHDDIVEGVLGVVFTGSHCLLEGVPGLGKTLLVRTLSQVLDLDFSRIQFTPDLMPADITGSEVMEETEDGKRSFRFIQGPVFCQLLMADEINRASPRTQSALLQAMQEKEVSVSGQRHPLPHPRPSNNARLGQ